MRILYVMSGLPYPPRGGGALRVMGLLTAAASGGHTLDLLSFGDPAVPIPPPLQVLCEQIKVVESPQRSTAARLRQLALSNQADMQGRFWSANFLTALEDCLSAQDYDIIQFQSLEMGVYLAPVRRIQPQAKLIYDAYNAEAELQRGVYQAERRKLKRWPMAAYSWVQWRRLGRFERELCGAADAVIAVSETDQALLGGVSQTPVHLVPNGIKVSDYATSPTEIKLKQPALVFTGTLDYRPNVDAALWFAEEIFPQVLAAHPQAHLYLVGNRPAPRIQALAEASEHITATGFVEDVRPYLHSGTLFIAPLRMGSGTRLKLLESMAVRLPIVSTTIGALGLGVRNGQEMLLADDPAAFAHAVNQLLDDPAERERLGTAAYNFVARNFDWDVIAPRLLALYAAL